MTSRPATHAGSWYTSSAPKLSQQLDAWLAAVPSSLEGVGSIPRPGARVIIAPHAGYSYSGPAAAWAYRCLDFSNAKRIFLLGPSHHVHLPLAALSAHSTYDTPLGPLALDTETIARLAGTGAFTTMSAGTDSEEHSLEMHLPYIHKMLSLHFPHTQSSSASQENQSTSWPLLTPILIPSLSASATTTLAHTLLPYLLDPGTLFILSSDFCHWGLRFQYTYYIPSSPSSPPVKLKAGAKRLIDPPIHASIATLDQSTMDAIESGSYDAFIYNLRETGNTVCGRYPIGVFMKMVELLREEGTLGDEEREKGRFNFVRYERSSNCVEVGDSSVSYGSGFAIL